MKLQSQFMFGTLLCAVLFSSCESDQKTTEQKSVAEQREEKEQVEQVEGDYTTLEGSVEKNSDGLFVFRGVDDQKHFIDVPTYLKADSEPLQEHLEQSYEDFVDKYGKREMPVIISGVYLNLHEYRNGTMKGDEKLTFLFLELNIG